MKNLRSSKELTGYVVHATDGDIGRVRELYFDDADWRVRYLVVDTGRWLPGRRILLPPSGIRDIRWEDRQIHVASTREQVRSGPAADTDKPVAEQIEAERRSQHNWALSLGGEALASVPEALQTPAFEPINKGGKPFDPHLRTTRVVIGMALRARDGTAGRIDDIVLDDRSWEIRYLVVDLGRGSRVAVPARLVSSIAVEERAATTDLPLRVLATGPSLDPSTLFTCQYEESILRHYQPDSRAQAGS